jgi:hypothetical protein
VTDSTAACSTTDQGEAPVCCLHVNFTPPATLTYLCDNTGCGDDRVQGVCLGAHGEGQARECTAQPCTVAVCISDSVHIHLHMHTRHANGYSSPSRMTQGESGATATIQMRHRAPIVPLVSLLQHSAMETTQADTHVAPAPNINCSNLRHTLHPPL